LEYHERYPKGKIEVIATKPCITQLDLSLAYTPGVAQPCLEIKKDPKKALQYTSKGNLVAVISNGTAVLGLGNIGPLAGKPVMEGKGVLFKRFANIDVFDIELDVDDPKEIIKTIKNISPTFGGINLEDIKAPECFYIEEILKRELKIPVFHDDQHGTAIIAGAGLLNALELVGKNIKEVKLVVSGAGAAGIACADFFISLGMNIKNLLVVDSKGVLWKGRGDERKNKYKTKFFRTTKARILGDAIKGTDVFIGVSVKGILTKKMVQTMAKKPIIFAMANPDPEITYTDAKETCPDAIVATGRSDYPNQVNNVLGFPFIFRGALDVEATAINQEMKIAAAYSLAALAKEDVPDSVKKVYGNSDLIFGPEYIIPKPFDPRVLVWEASAVAKAAMESGVAKINIDLDAYREHLLESVDWSRETMRKIHVIAKNDPKRIVFPEGDHPNIIWAANELAREGIAKPVLLGKSREEILSKFEELHHDPEGIEIIEPKMWPHRDDYVKEYYKLRQRKGITLNRATMDLRNYIHFGVMMVKMGHVDGMVAGISVNYPEVLRPALQIIGPSQNNQIAAGLYMILHNRKLYFMADCAVNISPSVEELVEIALLSASELERLNIIPQIAMLSFSNFGSVRCKKTQFIHDAVKIIKKRRPDLMVDGPIQADTALSLDFLREHFPFSDISKTPNLLIFPDLNSGNISLKLLEKLGDIHSIGPIMMGLDKPIHLLVRGDDVDRIVNLSAITCVDAQ
jgi:malate dehydrogenase (oxaloacetate-decarboxylating)(NADP+)